MAPTLFQIQNSRTFQGVFKDFSIFVKDIFVQVKKTGLLLTKIRPEGMKNCNFGVFTKFQTMHISEIAIHVHVNYRKYEM